MKKKRILIVEDERIVAEDIKHSLIKLGYDVSGIAASSEGALKNIRETFPDLILMDIVLRGKMTGVEASKEIRARYNIPIVYLTAYTNEKVLEQAKVTEPYGYIIKPFAEKELYSTLKIALYKHELETKLKESEERYRSIFSNSPDYIYLTDVEGNLLDANPALLNRIKLSVEDFHKMNFKDFYAGDNIEEALNSIAKIRKGNEIKGLQVRAKTPKGKIFECEVNAVPLWENGKVTKILNIARDITERKRAEEKERKYISNLKILSKSALDFVELSPEGDIFHLIAANIKRLVDDCYVVVNSYDNELNSLKVRSVAGFQSHMNYLINILGSKFIGMNFKITEDYVIKELNKCKIVKVPGKLHTLSFGKLSKKICTLLEKAFSINNIYTMGFSRKGKLYGNAVIFMKHKERLKNREAIEAFINQASVALQRNFAEEEIKKFKTISDRAGYGVAMCDIDGYILYINESFAKMHGYSINEIIGKNLSILHNKEQMTDVNRLKNVLYQKGEYNAEEIWHTRKDNTAFPTLTNGTLIRDEKGNPLFIAATAIDITERIKAMEELKQHQWMLEVSERELKKFSRRILSVREEEKKKLSANLHDEVGSMAVILSAHLSNIEEEIKDNNLKNALKIIDKSKHVFAKTITRLKNIAVNLRPPDLEIIGLPDALREYFFNMRKQTGITIHFRINMNNKKLSDEAAITLYRIVQESVTNIIKHAKATKITIQLSSMKGGTTLIVNDNGKGFAIRKRNQGTKSHIGIRGMTEMAESLGGTFDITSEPGRGTKIRVTLPHPYSPVC